MHLLFGDDKVLLLDTGATKSAVVFPLQATVEKLIEEWAEDHGKKREDLQLIVAHSHSHGDHISADGQFEGKKNTTVVGTSVADVIQFFGLKDWPNTINTYSLGGRELAVIPIPGHQVASISLYDCNTNLLYTGDTIYPGRLYIEDFQDNL
eukprot:CAMPEP_0174276426 /NCGR_PEP_ID=MMETSP0439-20130205/60376_1 /TAXON_ID=0 /ORGANISM="Stereomyxa ramosa, Strain Chinc5" /LENGTH=150 /DNA_ID=CAMNT_0015368649 /DNA_START=1179 /DNA_END=1631 /DNA_ORIENTATION=+